MEKEKREMVGAGELRRKAEERLKEKPAFPKKLTELEPQKLIQELRVHQIELEMQNEELRRAQAVVEESRAKYSDLYDFAPVGYLTLNRQGIILEANLTACSSLGKERSFLIDINNLFTNFIIKKVEKDLFYQHLGKVFEKKSLETCELELKGKGDTKFYAQLQSIVVKDNLSQCRTAITDITERKKAEAALMETVKAKSAFTSMVSHELRTPLAALKESVSQILEGMLGTINEDQRKILEIAKRNVDRLARLITEVLDFQTLEIGKAVFKMQDNDINEVVEETKETMDIIAKEKGLDFILNLDEVLPKIKFDRDKICQVLSNLINNSIKLTEKGSITISTTKGNNVIQVSVKDTGPGIKKEDMPRLFQQYEQLERKTGGTGLGLAISLEIIKAHGGNIWAESTFGQGTTMHFILPIEERRRRR